MAIVGVQRSLFCWMDTCLNMRDVQLCPRCGHPYCDEHRDWSTNLCMYCVPVAEAEYNEWVERQINRNEER